MWNKDLVRLFGVLLAVVITAAACASSETSNTATAETTAAVEAVNSNETPEAESVDDDHGDDDHGDDDHGDDDHGDDDHDDDDHDEHSHGDETIDVDSSLPIPGLTIDVTETNSAGTFAVAVSLENFTITPENIDADPIDNEGHMHLYLDGERVTRFTDLEIDVDVPDGEHLVEVELSANNHSPYSIDGDPIRASATVTGSGDAPPDPTATDADVIISATVTNNEVALDGDDRIELAEGDVVMVMVSSDSDDEVHVHGYDLFADVSSGQDAMIVFEANTPGRFEIELESSGLFLAELVIS